MSYPTVRLQHHHEGSPFEAPRVCESKDDRRLSLCSVVRFIGACIDIGKAAACDDSLGQQRNLQAADPLEDFTEEQSHHSMRRCYFSARSSVELLQVSWMIMKRDGERF